MTKTTHIQNRKKTMPKRLQLFFAENVKRNVFDCQTIPEMPKIFIHPTSSRSISMSVTSGAFKAGEASKLDNHKYQVFKLSGVYGQTKRRQRIYEFTRAPANKNWPALFPAEL